MPHSVVAMVSLSFLAKVLLHELCQGIILGGLGCVCLHEIFGLRFQGIIESKNGIGCYQVDDPCRGHAVHLFCQDVTNALRAVRVQGFQLFAAEQAFHDFRDVKAGFHIQVCKGLVRVVEAAGILLFQLIDHFLYHPFGGEDLIGFLWGNVVEYVFILRLVKVVGKLQLLFPELRDGIIEHDLIKQMSCEVLRLAGFFIDIVSAVAQEADAASEIFRRSCSQYVIKADAPTKTNKTSSQFLVMNCQLFFES